MERELIKYRAGLETHSYYQVIKEDDYLEIRYEVGPENGLIDVWRDPGHIYTSFRSPEKFKEFVKKLNEAVEELDAMKEEGLIQ